MHKFLLVALAGVAIPAQASANDRFDLICNGMESASTRAKPQPISKRYRIDLIAAQWCVDGCKLGTLPLVKVTPGELTLVDDVPQFASDDEKSITINRMSGDWSIVTNMKQIGFFGTVEGKCIAAPYSGEIDAKPRF